MFRLNMKTIKFLILNFREKWKRSLKLSQVLNVLSAMDVDFKLEGQKLIVINK